MNENPIDWGELLIAWWGAELAPFTGTRKLRLWTIACCRRVLGVALADPSFFSDYCTHDARLNDYWDDPNRPAAPVEAWHRQMELAERFADGMSKKALAGQRVESGGPWSLFHLPLSDSRMEAAEVVRTLRGFTRAYPVPTPDDFMRFTQDIFGNPFRSVAFDPRWRTEHTVGLAAKMYDDREFAAMPILADALEEAGCENADILTHCREPGVHVRGCWVADLVLGKA